MKFILRELILPVLLVLPPITGCSKAPPTEDAPNPVPPSPSAPASQTGVERAPEGAPEAPRASDGPTPGLDAETRPAPAVATAASESEQKPAHSTPKATPRAAKTTPAPEPAPAPTPSGKTAAYSGDDPCTTKQFKFAAVRAQCERGGRPAAKAMMKSLVKKAKNTGESVKCSTCHEDTKTFTLKSDAARELKRIMAL